MSFGILPVAFIWIMEFYNIVHRFPKARYLSSHIPYMNQPLCVNIKSRIKIIYS